MPSSAVRNFRPVEPDAYLQLAIEWAQSDDEATLRTAVDRAYYAAFLSARDELAAKGYASFAASSQAHGQVRAALSSVRRRLGRRLSALRRARNRLTYETGPTELPDGLTLQELLASARQIIAAVEALPEL